MKKQLYPHLTVIVNTEHLFAGLINQYENTTWQDSAERNRIRNKIKQKQDDMDLWLIRHGYECGAHYFECQDGYKFASGALATAFLLGVSR